MSVVPNKGGDILVPEECDLNLLSKATGTKGPAGCRLPEVSSPAPDALMSSN